MRKKTLLLLSGMLFTGSLFCQNDINVTVTELKDTVETGASTTKTFKIQNTGDADLDYEISIYTDTVRFTKEPYADYTLPENQDAISPSVILTRGTIKGLFNYAAESFADGGNMSPVGTLWYDNLTEGNSISNYSEGLGGGHSSGDEYSMYIPSENRFFDIIFHEWTEGGLGSGVSYTRVETVPWLSTTPSSGTITGGNEVTISVQFDATNTGAGIYNTEIVINSNDADEPEITIPVTMVDTGGTAAFSDDGDYNFGNITPNTTAEYNYTFKNSGDGILNITSITTSTSNFTVTPSQMELFGLLQGSINIEFTPADEILYKDTIVIESNAGTFKIPVQGTGYYSPNLYIDNEIITFTINIGESDSEIITLSNMNTNGDSVVWSFPESGSLPYMLANVNASTKQLKASVPNIFEFVYDGGGNYIEDGGADMYDDGNYLNTNYASEIDYTSGIVKNGEGDFGKNANYFTKELNGYFAMTAELDSVTSFSIEGELGADGDGYWDTLRANVAINNTEYLVITKQVNEDDTDPSVNHIFIMETPDSCNHFVNDDTDDDYNEIQFDGNVELLHYILVAARENGEGFDIDSATIFGIAEQYIEIVTAENGAVGTLPKWLSISDKSGVILEDSDKELTLTANTANLTAGEYSYDLPLYNIGEGFKTVKINLTVVDPVSIESESNKGNALIYPNPAKEILFVETEVGSYINLFSSTGMLMNTTIANSEKESLYIDGYTSGLYIIQVKNDSGTFNQQVIIE